MSSSALCYECAEELNGDKCESDDDTETANETQNETEKLNIPELQTRHARTTCNPMAQR